MKLVSWEDERGYMHQAYIPDGAPDSAAKESGIPHDPPDLSEIDWEEVAREIHNALVAQGLITWQDVMRQQTTLVPILTSSLKRRLQLLYRKKYEAKEAT